MVQRIRDIGVRRENLHQIDRTAVDPVPIGVVVVDGEAEGGCDSGLPIADDHTGAA